MYKRRITRSFFSRTPRYPGRNWIRKRLEGVMYGIFLIAAEDSRKILNYGLSEKEQGRILGIWGRLSILTDDLHESGYYHENLRRIITEQNEVIDGTDAQRPLLEVIAADAKTIREFVSLRWKEDFWKTALTCLDYQLRYLPTSEYGNANFDDLLDTERMIGGNFNLATIYLLDPDPERFSCCIREALFLQGAWGQAIDDYVDRHKDEARGIRTPFTCCENPKGLLEKLSNDYEKKIVVLTQREDCLIPLMKDLMWLARFAGLPIVSAFLK